MLLQTVAYLYSFKAGKFFFNSIGNSWLIMANIANHSIAARTPALLSRILILHKCSMMKPLGTMRIPMWANWDTVTYAEGCDSCEKLSGHALAVWTCSCSCCISGWTLSIVQSVHLQFSTENQCLNYQSRGWRKEVERSESLVDSVQVKGSKWRKGCTRHGGAETWQNLFLLPFLSSHFALEVVSEVGG